MQDCKIVVIGDGGVGKSCLLIACTTGAFPGDYIPTVFDNYASNITVDNRSYRVGLWDTAGQEDYDRLRPLSYPDTDVFLICYDVAMRASFTNVEEKWLPEVRHFAPDTPVVLVANKIDQRNNELRHRNVTDKISHEEGKAFAARLGIPTFMECSALTQEGISSIIPTAIRTAFSGTKSGRKSHQFWFQGIKIFSGKSKDRADEPQPPVMPPAGLAPWINVTTSTFADDLQRLLTDNMSQPDVKFIIDANVIHAHQIILASASVIFKEIFLSEKKINQVPKKYSKIFQEIKWVNEELSDTGLNNLNIDVEVKRDTRDSAEITLSQDINFEVFRKIVHFLYTGLPGFAEIEDKDFLCEVQKTAELFHLQWLTQVCENQLKDELYLNPSIGTWLNDETGSVMKTLFLNKAQLSDVCFSVEEQVVDAHKAILMARCDVMAAMLGGGFVESNNSGTCEIKDANLDSFLAVLEYLYTDHAPIEDLDSVDIMVMADRFCLPRLVTLCELYITKKVDKMIQKKVADGVEHVVNLLLLSQAHNASQLSQWCLHFIATNYSVFESSPAFSLLQDENKEYVEEHRWPPLSYFRALEEYQDKLQAAGSKGNRCKVM